MKYLQITLSLLAMTFTVKSEHASISERSRLPHVPSCGLKCSIPVSNPTFFYIHQNRLPVLTSQCMVNGFGNDQHCSIDISNLTGLFLSDDRSIDEQAIHYSHLVCNATGMQVSFTNKLRIEKKSFISYLAFRKCDVLWMDINTFGRAVDLRVLYLFAWSNPEKDRTPPRNNRPSSPFRKGALDTVPSGLANIGTLHFSAREPQPLPAILTARKWPKMAEFSLAHFSCENFEIFRSLIRNTMPILQTLDIQHSNMSGYLLSFPWSVSDLDLPLNLSRSAVFNDQYADQLGIQTDHNKYRRCLFLTNTNLQDLEDVRLKGKLSLVNLASNRISYITEGAFRDIEGLQALDLHQNHLRDIPEQTFTPLTNLTVLDLSYNRLTYLPISLFRSQINLKRLLLSHNFIENVQSGVLDDLISLQDLDLSYNRLYNITDDAIYQDQEEIQTILLNKNNLREIPVFVYLLRNLKYTDMSFNNLTFESFANNLKKLDPNHVIFQNSQSNTRFMPHIVPSVYKSVNLQNNSINTLPIDRLDLHERKLTLILFSFHNFLLDNNSLNCDCDMFSFFHLLKNIFFEVGAGNVHYNNFYERTLRCELPLEVSNHLLAQIPDKAFKCEAQGIRNCPKKCTCYNRTIDGAILVDCSSRQLSRLPNEVPDRTREIYLHNNRLKRLDSNPSYLNHLDIIKLNNNTIEKISVNFLHSISSRNIELHLQGNKLSEIPEDIQKVQFRTLDISRNPWICDCHAKWLKNWLIKHRNEIADLDGVFCATGKAQGKLVVDTNDELFICEVPTEIVVRNALLSVFGALLFVLIIAAIMFKFRGEIKVMLYVRFNWHPFDQCEEADLLDCTYDVFVSYCGIDYQWVCFVLLKKLEMHVPPWRACVHDRDFVVGNFIEENIIESVKASRRMIIVLTQNYLQSDWCMLEFKTAHRKVLKERTNYIILIVADDVKYEDLDDDMKLYVRSNTYISASNKWFWEKLFYALPHKPLCVLHHELNQTVLPGGQPLSAWSSSERTYTLSGNDPDQCDSGVDLNSLPFHIHVNDTVSQCSNPETVISYL